MGNLNVITGEAGSQELNENFANNCSYGVSSTGTDAYAITPVPAPVSYIAGQMFRFEADVANTGACTLNINTLGPVPIKMDDGSDPPDGFIVAGAIVTVIFDGANFKLPNSGIAKLSADLAALAGAGHTTETVKGNADALTAHKADNAAHGVDGKVNKAGDTMTGALQISSNRDNAGDTTPNPGNFSLEVAAGAAFVGIGQNNGDAVIQAFGTGTAYSLDLCPTAGIVKTKGNEIWHAGNLPYEEGTWTPVMYGETTAGTPTYSVQSGVYKRTGNQVYAWGKIRLSSKGGMVGDIRIGGLPFASSSTYRIAFAGLHTSITFSTNAKQLTYYIAGSIIEPHFIGDGQGLLQLSDINIVDGSMFTLTAIYDI